MKNNMNYSRQDQQDRNSEIETLNKKDLDRYRVLDSHRENGTTTKTKNNKGVTKHIERSPRKATVPPLHVEAKHRKQQQTLKQSQQQSQRQSQQQSQNMEEPHYVPSFAMNGEITPRSSIDVDSTRSDRSKTSPRQSVYDRLYDPNRQRMRNKTPQPHEVYNTNFKATIPPSMDHVHSLHRDQNYHQRLQEIRDTASYEEEQYDTNFKSNPPRALQNVHSLHRDVNYLHKLQETRDIDSYEQEHFDVNFRSKQPKPFQNVQSRVLDAKKPPQTAKSWEARTDSQFTSVPPKHLVHVESRLMDPRYAPEIPVHTNRQDDKEYIPEFRARPPRSLIHVESRILESRYFATRQVQEEELPDATFKAQPPKRLLHVQSRIQDPTYLAPRKEVVEEEPAFQTEFVAKPPKSLKHVESRILEPHYFHPKENKSEASEEEFHHTNFMARIPKGMEHVQSRIYEEKYFKRKVESTEDPTVERKNTEFKTKPPKELQNVKSRVFDPRYNVGKLPPPYEVPHELTMEQKGPLVFIKLRETKEDEYFRPSSDSYLHKVSHDGDKGRRQYGQWSRKDAQGPADIKQQAETDNDKKTQAAPQKKNPARRPRLIRKPKPEKISKSFFESWSESPDGSPVSSSNTYHRNRRHDPDMWAGMDMTMMDTGRGRYENYAR